MPITTGLPTESYTLDTYRNAYGTLILVGDGNSSGEVFHVVAGVGNIDGPNTSTSVVERLTHSTGNRYKGKDPGMIDPGSLKFPVAFDPSNPSHNADATAPHPFGLEYLYINQLKRNMQIATPKPGGGYEARQFRGFVSELGESYPVEGRMDRNCTIQIDGLMTKIADYAPPA
jgi:hypothetical protein